MISIQNLTKKFGQVTAVDKLSLEIPKGELFAFLGPNAAGKTTTIKLMAGLLKPSEGRILVGGHDVSGRDYLKARQLLSYVPDVPYLYEKLTAFEFLYFVARLYNFSPRDIEKKAALLLDLFGLSSHRDHLTEDFSHGMRQRLIMCAALIHEPQVMLIDEPMVGLDPRSSRLVKDILKAKSKEGMAIFISTHTLPLAEELADRIGIIDQSRLIALGTMETLRQQSGVNGHLEEVFLKLTREVIQINAFSSLNSQDPA